MLLLLLALAIFGLASAGGPNVLVIMSDDQDMLLDSLTVQPKINKLIGGQGVSYNRHYCTVAWCCPSRVNFLTGKAAHNSNVTTLTPPFGGWPKFVNEGHNSNYLPVWMKSKGINTYYAGKLMNGYSGKGFNNPHPKGWTQSSFLVDPWTYNYHQSHWTNGPNGKVKNYPGVHTTNVLQGKAMKMLDHAAKGAKSGEQFFMMLAPVAPHTEIAGEGKVPPAPPGWKGKFLGRKAPRRANFNPDKKSGASWVRGLPKLKPEEIKAGDEMHVGRLQNMAGIDDMVGKLIDKLKQHDILDNTYIIYTSDNGFHIGNHRLKPGKRCPYEEDINVPLLIRGPNVPHGVTSKVASHHTNMAPTILKMLGVPMRPDFDGEPVDYTKATIDNTKPSEHVSVEFWDDGFGPNGYRGVDSSKFYYNNTYKALRFWAGDYSFFYSVWCDNTREFYDMKTDHVRMYNRMLKKGPEGKPQQYFGRPEKQLFNRLDAILMVTKSCKQDSCRNPWKKLFPKGQVATLGAAMEKKYDKFFADQPKVSFKNCKSGFVVANEGPQHVRPFGGS
ncbi:hypothetical protein LTR37_006446 [Vermiconidia calcicola]|uniref:Uncharacterized protein n=1 Tax=Vermiconidia calcicola TaxID=1690605 RepID=A0ACC3NJF9_9PEZI|nr:hypothetical protein LTR37_006446 [Vermiconidia calcicola]